MESQLPAEEPRAALADLEQAPGAQQEGRAQGSSPGFQMETSPAASPAASCPEEDDSSTAGTRLPTLQELFSSTDSRTVIDLTESNDPMAHPARKRPASSGDSTKDTRKAKRQATCGQKKSTKEPPSFIPISFKADVEGIPVEFIWKQRAKGWIDQRDGEKRPVAEFIPHLRSVEVSQSPRLFGVDLSRNGNHWEGHDIQERELCFTNEEITRMVLNYERGRFIFRR